METDPMADRHDREDFCQRLRLIRCWLYGEEGSALLAEALGLPPRTWANYEAGVTMPATVALRLLCVARVDPEWLLTGRPGDEEVGGGPSDRDTAALAAPATDFGPNSE
jgi:hypothetical protein